MKFDREIIKKIINDVVETEKKEYNLINFVLLSSEKYIKNGNKRVI